MADKFRVATFNVENLFSRAKILNLRNYDNVDNKLATVDEFNKLIHEKSNFTTAQKNQILNALDQCCIRPWCCLGGV